jgi:hypothetical protein
VSRGEGAGGLKGTVLLSRLSFIKTRLPRGGERVLGRLPPEDRATLRGIVLPTSWYEFALCERLDRAIVEELGRGEDGYRDLGAWSAEQNLGSMHKSFIDGQDPHGLLRQAAHIYRHYYGSGHRTYERLSDTRAAVRTFGSLTFSRADCLSVAGWHEKAIALCGGVDPRVSEPQCRARGDMICEYLCEWKQSASIRP